jgi:hypothetical protein
MGLAVGAVAIFPCAAGLCSFEQALRVYSAVSKNENGPCDKTFHMKSYPYNRKHTIGG